LKSAGFEAEFVKAVQLDWPAEKVIVAANGPRGLLAAVNSSGQIVVVDGEETEPNDSDVSQLSVDGDSHSSD
jgi:hypothetical protein